VNELFWHPVLTPAALMQPDSAVLFAGLVTVRIVVTAPRPFPVLGAGVVDVSIREAEALGTISVPIATTIRAALFIRAGNRKFESFILFPQ
jgi:hypothetical protein